MCMHVHALARAKRARHRCGKRTPTAHRQTALTQAGRARMVGRAPEGGADGWGGGRQWRQSQKRASRLQRQPKAASTPPAATIPRMSVGRQRYEALGSWESAGCQRGCLHCVWKMLAAAATAATHVGRGSIGGVSDVTCSQGNAFAAPCGKARRQWRTAGTGATRTCAVPGRTLTKVGSVAPARRQDGRERIRRDEYDVPRAHGAPQLTARPRSNMSKKCSGALK